MESANFHSWQSPAGEGRRHYRTLLDRDSLHTSCHSECGNEDVLCQKKIKVIVEDRVHLILYLIHVSCSHALNYIT